MACNYNQYTPPHPSTLPPTTSCDAPVSLPFPLLREFLWEEPGQKKEREQIILKPAKKRKKGCRLPPPVQAYASLPTDIDC